MKFAGIYKGGVGIEYYNSSQKEFCKGEVCSVDACEDGTVLDIDISGVIGLYPVWGGAFRSTVNEFIDSGGKQLRLFVQSPGGVVADGLEIHDFLSRTSIDVDVYYEGMPASASTIIGSSGNKVYMSKNAMGLIHSVSIGMYGSSGDLSKASKVAMALDGIIASIYADLSKRNGKDVSKEDFLAKMQEDVYLTAEEFKALGLVSEIYDPKQLKRKNNNTKNNNMKNDKRSSEGANDEMQGFLSAVRAFFSGSETPEVSNDSGEVSGLLAENKELKASLAKKGIDSEKEIGSLKNKIVQLRNELKELKGSVAEVQLPESTGGGVHVNAPVSLADTKLENLIEKE